MILVDHPTRTSKKFYVYILRSLVDGSYYVGSTQNVTLRLKQHNLGKSTYTKGHRPYELVYTEDFRTRREAETREKSLKKRSIKTFLKSRVPPTLLSRD
jgi:predicted GIY-YIG superfamily endonuclease